MILLVEALDAIIIEKRYGGIKVTWDYNQATKYLRTLNKKKHKSVKEAKVDQKGGNVDQ